ncbi:MAG: CHASE3 domain-containing protein [Rhodospirillaceae bacterium]|nr:CHASE3 domain-containing protein [Rhodospirillaceae bacterium]
MQLNRLTMTRWGQAILIPAIIFVVVFSMMAVLARQYAALQQDQARAEDLKSGLTAIYIDLQEAESGVRGFVVSGNEEYLAPMTRASEDIPAAFVRLGPLVTPAQKPAVDEFQAEVTTRMTQLKNTPATLTAPGGLENIADNMRTVSRGRATMREVRATLERIVAGETAAVAEHRRNVRRMGAYIQGLSWLTLFAVMTIAFIGLMQARRRKAEIEAAHGALHEANLKLSAEIAEREAIEEQLRQAQKMEAIGQLTGGIAHDFNNMLAVIMGALNIMQRRINRGDYNIAGFVDAAIEGAQRGGALTQRLLAFARKQMLEPRVLDCNKLVSGMSDLLRRTLGETIQTEVVLAGGLWRVHADPHQLETAILNLVVNARDAMEGGGKLTIETANAHFDDAYALTHKDVPAGQYVVVAVTDTGTGMAPEVLNKAFDPFFTTKSSGKGTGLGLSQVYGFVRQSGGHVKICSELGHGANVKIYLPRYHGPGEDVPAPRVTDPDSLPKGNEGETILVVEDEDAVRRLAVDGLRDLGYTVIDAESPEAALDILDQEPGILLLFTDVVMPRMNGRQLAEEAQRRRPKLKVLYTTGYTRNAVVHNGTLDPNVRLLGKPYSLENLARRVREILDTRGLA